MSKKYGIIYHSEYLKHETGAHPENKKRLIYIMEYLNQSEIKDAITYILPQKATEEEVSLIHPYEYIKKIESACASNQQYLDADTVICSDSYNVALLAVGGVLKAIDEMMSGNIENGFALIRPPGHHAEPDRAMGFCIFNNIAIGTKYAQRKYGIERVLIIDFDVHHGNGTERTFYDDPTVLFFSIHQYPHYPGTGRREDKGIGKGEGYNINLPMNLYSGDKEYEQAFTDYLIEPVDKFKPELIMVSAGFDGHISDPLSQIYLSDEWYKNTAVLIHKLANSYAGGRVVSVLEGGYNLKHLPKLVEKYIEGFLLR